MSFLKGYKLAIQSAKDHFEVGKMCADKNLYGIANSHLILASEEGIKAAMLFAKYKKPNIRIEDFDKYFSDHKHKHGEILSLEKEFYMMNRMLGFVLNPLMEKYQEKGPLEADEIIKIRDKGVEELIDWLKLVVKNKGDMGFDDGWFKSANHKKNMGFYVHYERSGKWNTPSMIGKKEYQKSFELVSRLLDMFEKFEILYDDPIAQNMLRMMDEKGIFD